MRVLSVTAECVPLVKTGGLADVAGALPGALAPEGIEMRTMLPGYRPVMEALEGGREVFATAEGRVLEGRAAGLDLFVLDAPALFDRPGLYVGEDGEGYGDNPQRFAAFCRAAAGICAGSAGWVPELAHCHDWHAGLVPLMTPLPSVMTIHNIAFQGWADASLRGELGIPDHAWHPGGAEYYGGVSTLKAGIVYADAVTTVSPTYAREVTTPEFGLGLEGVLAETGVVGILNGIDEDDWAPPYRDLSGKERARAALLKELGIEAPGPLACVVSRLSAQKGLDVLLSVLPGFLEAGGAFALLGSGDKGLEAGFMAMRGARCSVTIGYDEALSHRLVAGSDAILVPSRFEPCGLTQLYGLHHGTVPVVARTGGLADTVIDANDAALKANAATGIVVEPGRGDALATGLAKLMALHGTPAYTAMQEAGMRHPVGWGPSAARYAELYRGLT